MSFWFSLLKNRFYITVNVEFAGLYLASLKASSLFSYPEPQGQKQWIFSTLRSKSHDSKHFSASVLGDILDSGWLFVCPVRTWEHWAETDWIDLKLLGPGPKIESYGELFYFFLWCLQVKGDTHCDLLSIFQIKYMEYFLQRLNLPRHVNQIVRTQQFVC